VKAKRAGRPILNCDVKARCMWQMRTRPYLYVCGSASSWPSGVHVPRLVERFEATRRALTAVPSGLSWEVPSGLSDDEGGGRAVDANWHDVSVHRQLTTLGYERYPA